MEKDAAWTAELAATHTRLQTLQEDWEAAATGTNSKGMSDSSANRVSLQDVNALHPVEGNTNMPEIIANVMIKEQAHITLYSNKYCDPSSPGFNMGIPSATYDKAMQ